jgi:predicted XRE-type DNA-binding protein
MNIDTGYTVPAGESVLDHLGRSPSFAAKAKLAIIIAKTIEELGLSQRQVQQRTGIPQARISEICRGKLKDISRERLEDCLQQLGHDVIITVATDRHEGAGELRVERSDRIPEIV